MNLGKILIPAVALVGVSQYTYLEISDGGAVWLIRLPVVAYLLWAALKSRSWFKRDYIWVTTYAAWIATTILVGIFAADSYWQWKSLVTNATALLLVLMVFYVEEPNRARSLLVNFVRFVIPTFFLVAAFLWRDAWGIYLALMPILILALPYLRLPARAAVICFSLVVVLGDLAARSSVLKFSAPFLFVALWGLPGWALRKATRAIQITCLVAPILLFVLGASGIFNVFKMQDYISWEQGEIVAVQAGRDEAIDLKADTRTFIYEEIIQSVISKGAWLFGRSPALGYDTVAFASLSEIYGKAERPSSEVGALNVFMWSGVVGLALYGALFIFASGKAIADSGNRYCLMLGAYVAFRWMFAWVEDGTYFNLNYLGVWLMVGLCMSRDFRRMTDDELTQWLRSLFWRGRAHSTYLPQNENARNIHSPRRH